MIDPEDIERVRRSQRARQSAIRGDEWQEAIGHRLRLAGLKMVERIETGWDVVRRYDPRIRKTRIVDAKPKAKVNADWTAVMPGGRSVRCEAKMRSDGQLSLSDFAPHQLDAMTMHTALGGLTLVGWAHVGGLELLEWPIRGLVKGEPLNVGDERTVAARWKGIA